MVLSIKARRQQESSACWSHLEGSQDSCTSTSLANRLLKSLFSNKQLSYQECKQVSTTLSTDRSKRIRGHQG